MAVPQYALNQGQVILQNISEHEPLERQCPLKCESSEIGETYTPKNIWLSLNYSFVDARKHLLASGSTSFYWTDN